MKKAEYMGGTSVAYGNEKADLKRVKILFRNFLIKLP